MQGSFLRFYVHEGHRHRHDVVWEWLLMQANKLGIRGGSAFKAMKGFGRHHKLNEDRLMDFTGSSVIEIEFIVTDQEAQQLFNLIHKEKITLFYAWIPARFGVIDLNATDPPVVAPDDGAK
jgi:PII-like signaling protein